MVLPTNVFANHVNPQIYDEKASATSSNSPADPKLSDLEPSPSTPPPRRNKPHALSLPSSPSVPFALFLAEAAAWLASSLFSCTSTDGTSASIMRSPAQPTYTSLIGCRDVHMDWTLVKLGA